MPSPKRGPMIILSLLILMLGLSIGAIALIVLFNSNRPTAAELTAACQSQVGSAISAEYQQTVDACKQSADAAAKNALNVVVATTEYPGFSYPLSWTAVGTFTKTNGGSTESIDIAPNFLQYSNGTAPNVPINISVFSVSAPHPALDAQDKFEAYVKTQYSGDCAETLTFKEETIGAASVYDVSGSCNNTIEDIYYRGTDQYVVAHFEASVTTAAEAWQIIKNSLDFSSIK